jgi:hypothetical protein
MSCMGPSEVVPSTSSIKPLSYQVSRTRQMPQSQPIGDQICPRGLGKSASLSLGETSGATQTARYSEYKEILRRSFKGSYESPSQQLMMLTEEGLLSAWAGRNMTHKSSRVRGSKLCIQDCLSPEKPGTPSRSLFHSHPATNSIWTSTFISSRRTCLIFLSFRALLLASYFIPIRWLPC